MSHPDGPRTARPPVYASRGMIAAPHTLASSSGLDALRRGGSAVDAAIAANAVLCVAYPHMAGLGGDSFWLIAGGDAEGVEAIEASGPAAGAATTEYYAERGHTEAIPMRGPLAALTVPGAVDGWRLAHERHGKLPWASLFADAIVLAREGVGVSSSLADWIAADETILRGDETMTATYLPEGRPQREGALLRQAELADSFAALAADGARAAFYEGHLAESICAGLRETCSPLATSDFAAYRARWVDPISTTYRGREVYQLPPSTQGFAALQILNLLDGYDVASWGEGSADYYHHLVEATKVAFADRDEWLSDPGFVDIPLDRLLSKNYADTRRSLISSETALPLGGIEPGVEFGGDFVKRSPDGDTVYFCATDSNGLTVSIIQSIYHDFGAAVMGGDTGIVMQNRGSFFALDPAHPNALAPGKRTFHTIIPAMMLENGAPVLAYGSMGGEGQPQTQAAMLTRLVDFGYDVQQAIEAPRWLSGRTWGTQSLDLWLEGRIPDGVGRELKLRGQPVKWLGEWDGTFGHAQAIRFDPATGLYEGGADPRGDGAAVGY